MYTKFVNLDQLPEGVFSDLAFAPAGPSVSIDIKGKDAYVIIIGENHEHKELTNEIKNKHKAKPFNKLMKVYF